MTLKQYGIVAVLGLAGLGLLSAAQGGSFEGSNGLIAFTCGANVCTVNPDGSGLSTLVSNASDPSWSADGSKIAYAGGGGIVIANANGTSPQVVAGGATQPTWSADGQKIAYAKAGDIYVSNINGTGQQDLTNTAAVDADPSFSPDGTKIAFVTQTNGRFDLWTVSVSNPASLTRVCPSCTADQRSPNWAPDGQTIAFTYQGHIDEIDPSGTDTPFDVGLAGSDPAFSPDGLKLAYIDAAGHLSLADALGRNAQAIQNGTGAQVDWQAVGSNAPPPVFGSGPPSNVTYPSITLPTGASAPVVGQALGSSVGTWSGTAPLTYTYQWKRCEAADRLNGTCVEIPGATSASYAPTIGDAGMRLRLAVTATNAQGNSTQNSEPSEPVVSLPARNTATPPIEGQNMVDQTLSLGPGVWTGTLPITFTYSWRRCNPYGDLPTCVQIPGANNTTYVPTTADIGYAIRVWVTGTNIGGSDVVITNHTYPIVDKPHFAPSADSKATVQGMAVVGRDLQATPPAQVFSGEGPISMRLMWMRCDATGASCHQILEASKDVYTPTNDDVGYTLRVSLTASNPYGSTTTQSEATDPVLAAPPHHEGKVILGTGGVDFLAGGGWDDRIAGEGGNDTLLGGNGYDALKGGPGNDVLFGGAGVDTIDGGAGSDTIYAADGERDIVDCGPGRDRAVVDAFDKVVGCEVVEKK